MDKVIASIEKLELSDKVKNHLEFTQEEYYNLVNEILKLDDRTKRLFLLTLKDNELINNQETELEDKFLMELYKNYQKQDSIEIVTKSFKDGIITLDEFKKLHRVVIKGSSDDIKENYDFRTDNNKWVGGMVDGKYSVDYYPPDYEKINDLINYTLNFLNDDELTSILNNSLIKPFIVHGLIAYIQPFGNGNTRVSRVLQHGKIWQMTNKELGTELVLPVLYLSRNYLQSRAQYRKLISQVANDQKWNEWLDYNLNMVDEQLYFTGENLAKTKRLFNR